MPRLADLEHRAVLRNALRNDKLSVRSKQQARKHPPITLTLGQARRYPLLASYLDAHGGWPNLPRRRAGPRLAQLEAMHKAYGHVVLLTVALPDLNGLPLDSRELADAARCLLPQVLADLLDPDAPYTGYTSDLQRGGLGGMHAHVLTPLEALLPELQAQVWAAPHGPNGGCELLGSLAHAVVICNTPANRAKVARYVSRGSDSDLDDPSNLPAYLAALERRLDRLTRQRAGTFTPGRMSWEEGVRRLSYRVPIPLPTSPSVTCHAQQRQRMTGA